MQLQVHLENEEYLIFDKDDPDVAQGPRDTHLTAFFKANQRYPEAHSICYPNFPSEFTWHHKLCHWNKHKAGKTSGRMVFVPSSAGERFYACLLLSVLTDVRSFEHLRTVGGIVYPTYQEACLARGLLADNNEWKSTLEEGVHMQTGRQLHQLFVTIVAYNQPSQSAELWHLFKSHLCDDLPRFLARHHNLQLNDNLLYDYGLYLIQQHLLKDDKCMQSVGLPNPCHDWDTQLSINLSSRAVDFDPDEQSRLLDDIRPHLNEEQLTAFNLVLDAAVHQNPVTFFCKALQGQERLSCTMPFVMQRARKTCMFYVSRLLVLLLCCFKVEEQLIPL